MFNFTVPYLSCIAIFLLMVAAVVLYIMPIRYLLMLWGLNKFFRRILRPHSVPNNELLDLLSRIPDDEMLVRIFFLFLRFGQFGIGIDLEKWHIYRTIIYSVSQNVCKILFY